MIKHRRKAGIVLICAGALAVLSAAGLQLYNMWDDSRAAATAASIVNDLVLQISGNETQPGQSGRPAKSGGASVEASGPPATAPEEESGIFIDGESYIAVLSIPSLGVELPVNSSWSYPKLKKSPCRYSGEIGGALVIAAHNYKTHFGRISALQFGDLVILTDAHGGEHSYTVIESEVLEPTGIEEMVETEYDLTLFTCTYSGVTRLAVRCAKVS